MTIKDEMKKIEGFKDRVICLASKIVGRSEVKQVIKMCMFILK